MKKRNVFILGSIACFVLFCVIIAYAIFWQSTERSLYKISSCLKLYIIENDGCFPVDQNSLIEKGLFKVETYGELDPHYKIRFNFHDVYLRNPKRRDVEKHNTWGGISYKFFNKFNIRYGTRTEEIEIFDGKIYDRESRDQVFLVDSRYRRKLRKELEAVSVDLYAEMLRLQKQPCEANTVQKADIKK